MSNITIQRALISVSDKSGIVAFAQSLHAYGIELISTGGTAKTLSEAGLPVTNVESLTGYPEMLDGRVKTLHPAIHGALLGVRDEPSHAAAMEEHEIKPIDLICIDLYPFEQTASRSGVADKEVIEQIDIGGPAMIRSASKNHRYVTVVTTPQQYELVLEELRENDGSTSSQLRSELASDAFSRTAKYDEAIHHWMANTASMTPTRLNLSFELEHELRYGENPDQTASIYKDPLHAGSTVVSASVIAGKPLSYNNLLDAAAALELVQDLAYATGLPTAVIIKHANPCGAAVGKTCVEAFCDAWKCDTLAAFGGVVALSEEVDVDIAQSICGGDKFLEVIVAPSFTESGAKMCSQKWKKVRLLAVGVKPRQDAWQHIRSIEGGLLVQSCRPVLVDASQWKHVAGPEPTRSQLKDATIAWITSSHLKSNAISIVDNGVLIGGGMGQVDRVSAARLAVHRAGDALKHAKAAVAGSDAFFPFCDGPEMLIGAGVSCIVHPGGSKRDQETIDLCNARSVTLLHTGNRRFKH